MQQQGRQIQLVRLPIEQQPQAHHKDDDHHEAVRLDESEPPFGSRNNPHQADVHHEDRPHRCERMGRTDRTEQTSLPTG